MDTRRSLPALVIAVSAMVGCVPAPPRSVSLANDTSRSVVLVVNGQEQSVVQPHQSVTVPASRLDAGDWFVEARLGQVTRASKIGVWILSPGSTREVGPAGLSLVDRGIVDLSCGSIAVWTGARPIETAGVGAPGDCTD